MDEQRLQAVLAALLREAGRSGPGPDSTRIVACGPSVVLAREWLVGHPGLSGPGGFGDAVVAEIEAGAEAAYARLGFQYVPQAEDGLVDSAEATRATRVIRGELERIPDGPAECVLAALVQVLGNHFSGQPAAGSGQQPLAGWHDVARLNAALVDLLVRTGPQVEGDQPLLFVRGELGGLDEQIFGAAESRFVPPDKPSLIGRAYGACSLGGAIARRLLSVCDSPELAQVSVGHGRFLLLVPNLPEVVQRLTDARARIEQDLLRLFEGELSPCISLTAGGLLELTEFAGLRRRIGEDHRRRVATPFLDALESEQPFGPYGTGMEDEQSVRSREQLHRELGDGLRAARFGIECESWPPRFHPLSDEAALAGAMDARVSGSVRVEWPGTRDGMRSAFEVSARHGGRILLGPSSSLPVQCDVEPHVPMAAAYGRIRLLVPDLAEAPGRPNTPGLLDAPAAEGLLAWMHRGRLIDGLTRAGAAGLAQGRAITIITGSGSRLVAVGPMKAMLSFIGRVQTRLVDLLGAERVALDVGVAVRSGRVSMLPDDRSSVDFARLVRQAREVLIESGSALSGPGRCWLFGAEVETGELAHLQQLGDDLAQLSFREPSRVRAMLETAVRVGRGGDAIPLSEVSRLRAKIHQLAARLGVNARALEMGGDGDSAEIRALKELILNFDRMFDSGAARVPLAYAVTLTECHAKELSS